MPVKRTTPPQGNRPVALYDGHCPFCTSQAEKLKARARGAIDIVDFQKEGVLERFPGLTHEECMRAMQLIAPDGRVFAGAEAVVRALRAGRPVLGRMAMVYYVPGVRQIMDWGYAWVARNRYWLFGKKQAKCDEGGSCSLHGR